MLPTDSSSLDVSPIMRGNSQAADSESLTGPACQSGPTDTVPVESSLPIFPVFANEGSEMSTPLPHGQHDSNLLTTNDVSFAKGSEMEAEKARIKRRLDELRVEITALKKVACLPLPNASTSDLRVDAPSVTPSATKVRDAKLVAARRVDASFGRSIAALAHEPVENSLRARAASDTMSMIARRVGCDAAVVGSCSHGLATSHSDVDIVVCMRDVASDGFGARPVFWSEVCERDPPLVCALLGAGRLSAITTTKSMKGRTIVKRRKNVLERALAKVLAEEGFADPLFKRGKRCKEAPTLLRLTHSQTDLKVDIWCDLSATCAIETAAARRTAAVKAEVAREPLILPLHRLLRMAVGHELRVFEGYAALKSGSMGGYPVFLLVRRFLEREVRRQGEQHALALRAFVRTGDAASGAAESVGKLAQRLLHELGAMCRLDSVTSETKVGEAMGDLVMGCPAIQLGGLGALLLSSVSRRMLDAVQGGAPLRALLTQGTEERLVLVADVCDELGVSYAAPNSALTKMVATCQMRNQMQRR